MVMLKLENKLKKANRKMLFIHAKLHLIYLRCNLFYFHPYFEISINTNNLNTHNKKDSKKI